MLKEQSVKTSATNQNNVFIASKKLLALAKKSHEQYLLTQQQVDFDNAIDYYVRAMKLTPHFSEPYYKLALLLYSDKQITLQQALKQCKKAVALTPESPKARFYYGYFLNLAGQTKNAKEQFKKALSMNFLTSSRARIALALSIFKEMKQGKYSINEFSKALYYLLSGSALTILDFPTISLLYKIALVHISVFYYYLKGFLLNQAHKYDSAVKNFEIAAKNTAKTDDFYVKAGDSAYRNKKTEIAVMAYKKAISLNPENVNAILKLTTLLQKQDSGYDEDLIECYNRLVKIYDKNPRLYYDLGNLYLKIDDKFSALNAFKLALELDENNPFFMNSLAYVLIQLKLYDDALIYYKKAIKINPDNKWTSIVCQAHGAIYHQIKGNLEAAMVSYEMATVLDPTNPDAYFSIGEIYQDEGDYDTAVEYYCKSLKLKETPKAYHALGILLWEEDRIDESILAFEKCLALDENDYEAYNNLGSALLDGTGDIEKAVKCFKTAIQLNPNDAIAYYNLGKAYKVMGIQLKSAENFQMALNLNKITNVMDSDEILNHLHSLFEIR